MSSPERILSQCSECGHKHYDAAMKLYEPCPLQAEGCACPAAKGDACPEVYELREKFDAASIFWMPVRTYPNATYVPDGLNTIWYVESDEVFLWGHAFEYKDATPEDVIKRLAEQSKEH